MLIGTDKQPVLFSWIERMKQVDAIKQTLIPDEGHLAYLNWRPEQVRNQDYSGADVDGKGIKMNAANPE